MIIFLYGEDAYRIKEKLKEIVEKYKEVHKSGLNFSYFDFDEIKSSSAFSDFKDCFRQTSMFKEKRLAILKNPSLNSYFKDAFLKNIRDFYDSDDLIVVLESKEIKKTDNLLKTLKSKAKCQEFSLLSGQKLKNWIKNEAEKYGARINAQAIEKLVNFVGNDLFLMSNEINKLANFEKGKEIRPESVDLMVRSKIETDIFKTIDAVALKDKKQALKLITKHIEKGDSPLYLLSMINYQFKNLLVVKDLIEKSNPYEMIIKKTKLHPYVIKKSYFQCQRFSLPELKKICKRIFQADLEIKTGKIEPSAALDLLIAEI